MNPAETITILRNFNKWRRGNENIPQLDAREIGKAIDAAVEMIEHMEKMKVALREIAWSNDSAWQADRARSVLEESK